jgi:flagellar biosynthesis/type III secretory pathway chaperone
LITLARPIAADDALLERQQDALLERVSAALDAERAALMSGDEERLSRAEREKSSLIDALLGEKGAKGPGSPDPSSPAPFSGPAARSRLRELAGKNRLNGLLIAERLGEVQRRRQFFERIAGRDSVYGPDGVTRPASTSQLSSRI